MADNNEMVVHVDEHGTKYHEDAEGNKIYHRPCVSRYDNHDPHAHKSYYFSATPAANNAWCSGDKDEKPVYPASNPYRSDWGKGSTYRAPALKDYAADAENFPVSDPITVSQARKIAFDMHENQKDKAGHPYSEHLHAVEMGVRVLGGSDEERVAALFHDAVEDHHTTYALLKKINVTPQSLVMIEAVSKRSNEEQSVYLERIHSAGKKIPLALEKLVSEEEINSELTSAGARRVKIADLLHNTRHDRIQALRDDKRGYVADRLLKKYRPALASLMLANNMIVDEDEQKKLATKPAGSAGGYTYTSNYKPKKYTEVTIDAAHLMVGDKVKKDQVVSKSTGKVVSWDLEIKEIKKVDGATVFKSSANIEYEIPWGDSKAGPSLKVLVPEVEKETKSPAVPKSSPLKGSEQETLPTMEEPYPQPHAYSLDEILPGDWIREMDAPIIAMEEIKDSSPTSYVMTLATGEELEVPAYKGGYKQEYWAYPAFTWRNDLRLFADVGEELWDHFAEVCAPFDTVENAEGAEDEEIYSEAQQWLGYGL